MAVEVGFWRIEKNKLRKVEYSSIDMERRLEDLIESDFSILNTDLMLIGRQVRTSYGKIIDLLAMDADGKITIIELKRNHTPREVVAQTLDYASWLEEQTFDDIKRIYREYKAKELEEGYSNYFNRDLPEHINQEHEMLIVCSSLDHESERIISYLSEKYDVPINVVFFRYFKDGSSEYLSRSWMIDPTIVEEKAINAGAKDTGEVWNGHDFVANIDEYNGISTWEDAVKYGFISAGGGLWYSRTLNQLKAGHRVFAYIPATGFVGVGDVVEPSVAVKDFMVSIDGVMTPIANAPLASERMKVFAQKSEDETEYLVRVKWIKTVKETEAFKEKGLRANQNSVFKLKSSYTLNKLLNFFGLEE